MSKTPTLGWKDQPLFWSYSVAFKRTGSSELKWIATDSQDVCEASRAAQRLMSQRHRDAGYREYGVSKSYWCRWPGWDEPLTEEEYHSVVGG